MAILCNLVQNGEQLQNVYIKLVVVSSTAPMVLVQVEYYYHNELRTLERPPFRVELLRLPLDCDLPDTLLEQAYVFVKDVTFTNAIDC